MGVLYAIPVLKSLVPFVTPTNGGEGGAEEGASEHQQKKVPRYREARAVLIKPTLLLCDVISQMSRGAMKKIPHILRSTIVVHSMDLTM